MKFKVDEDTCIGCGQCINICDSVFAFNDDGLAEAIKEKVEDNLIEEATEAMENCPVGAITTQD